MIALWPTLVQFLLRLCCGLAVAMGITPSRWVTSGYYRVHLWVVMGLATFVSLAVYSQAEWFRAHGAIGPRTLLALVIGIAIASYVGAVAWMYEASQLGKSLLGLVAALSLAAGCGAQSGFGRAGGSNPLLIADWITSAAQLGLVTAAMFLGHWYLNWPGMKLEPLRRLVALLGMAIAVRFLVAAIGLGFTLGWCDAEHRTTAWWCFLTFRYAAGFLGPAVFAVLTWQTLKIPNTQSATGILYAAVILSFLGELTSQLMSQANRFPL